MHVDRRLSILANLSSVLDIFEMRFENKRTSVSFSSEKCMWTPDHHTYMSLLNINNQNHWIVGHL